MGTEVCFPLSLSSAFRAPTNSHLQPDNCSLLNSSFRDMYRYTKPQTGRQRETSYCFRPWLPQPFTRFRDRLQKLINQLTAQTGGKGPVPDPGVGKGLLLHSSHTARSSASFGREGCAMLFLLGNVIYCINWFGGSIFYKRFSLC